MNESKEREKITHTQCTGKERKTEQRQLQCKKKERRKKKKRI